MEQMIAAQFIRNVRHTLEGINRVVLVKMWHAYDVLPRLYNFSKQQLCIIQMMKRLISDRLHNEENDGGNV